MWIADIPPKVPPKGLGFSKSLISGAPDRMNLGTGSRTDPPRAEISRLTSPPAAESPYESHGRHRTLTNTLTFRTLRRQTGPLRVDHFQVACGTVPITRFSQPGREIRGADGLALKANLTIQRAKRAQIVFNVLKANQDLLPIVGNQRLVVGISSRQVCLVAAAVQQRQGKRGAHEGSKEPASARPLKQIAEFIRFITGRSRQGKARKERRLGGADACAGGGQLALRLGDIRTALQKIGRQTRWNA